MRPIRAVAVCLGVCLLLVVSTALEFDMVYVTKCISEVISENSVTTADYALVHKDDPTFTVTFSIKVEDPHGRTMYERNSETAPGHFVFTAKMTGEYKACFTVPDAHVASNAKLRFEWRTGVAAMDWDAIAKKDHLDNVHVAVRKLEEMIKAIHSEMYTLRQREEQMRNLNEATNRRVTNYSMGTVIVCVLLGAGQLFFLTRFFQRKKVA